MAKDSGAGVWPVTQIGMNIRAANGRHGNPNQYFIRMYITHWKLADFKRGIGGVINGGAAGFGFHGFHYLFLSFFIRRISIA
jgi:hypothetical protein